MIARRQLIVAAAAGLAGCRADSLAARSLAEDKRHHAETALRQLEQDAGGRLGVFALVPASGISFGYRQGARFGMCSTFKLSLAAFVLREADAGRLSLDERIGYSKADLTYVSPVTTSQLERGWMTLAELARAAQVASDNAAANLLLRRIGGPGRLTRFWRDLGDRESRLDRYEPELNLVPPGELRDTATPRGFGRSAAKLVLGDVLAPGSRALIRQWMDEAVNGTRRIRAALPPGWHGGDKPGTAVSKGNPNLTNDVAVLYPPSGRDALAIAAFYQAAAYFDGIRAEDEAVLKRVGEIAIQWAS